ncbi:MAG: amidase family protein [Steroidobacteraceae bacterium]
MARRVADAAIMFDAIAGQDPSDPTSLAAPPATVMKDLDKGVRGMRIGLDRDYALKGIDGGQAAAIEAALKVLTGLGARVVDVRMPDLTGVMDAWFALCASEIVVAHAANYPSRATEYGPYMREFLETGARITPQQVAAAQKKRAEFTVQFNAVLESVDAMAGPAGGHPAWPITRVTGGLAARVSQGMVRCGASQQRVHHADGSCRGAGNLPAVGFFVGRAPVQYSVQRAKAQ